MPDWTKKNFEDLEDRSPADAPMQWRLARNALHSPELGVSRFTYEPGARMPDGLDLICIGGRRPKSSDTERLTDFWK
jgi:hypothetical protein